MTTNTLIHHIAQELFRMRNNDVEISQRGRESVEALCREFMPSGSGFDNGTTIDFDRCKPERVAFFTMFHHMSESGMYDGWTEHRVTVSPSLLFGFTVSVGGRDRNDIKGYIADTFHNALDQLITARFDPAEKSFTYRLAA